jgi:hypothetical protein
MTGAAEGEEVRMLLLDLGKKKRRDIKRLRKGRGRLMRRLNETLEGLKDEGTIATSSQPVIVIVRERSRSGGLRLF